MRPKIEMPAENDFIKAMEFFDYKDSVYTDHQRKNISDMAYKIMLKRKTKQ